jgi:hypothetical protein
MTGNHQRENSLSKVARSRLMLGNDHPAETIERSCDFVHERGVEKREGRFVVGLLCESASGGGFVSCLKN